MSACGAAGAAVADCNGRGIGAGAFAVAIDWLAEARGPFCLWLHVQGLGAAWDAPAEFRRLLAASPYLMEYVPALHQYVETYPKGSLAGQPTVHRPKLNLSSRVGRGWSMAHS